MIVLCITPFVYAYYIRPKTKTSKVWRNIFTVLSNKLPSFDIIVSSMKNIRERFAEGLRKSDNFRKFFTRITLLIIIAFQFVDFHAAVVVNSMKNENATDVEMLSRIDQVYSLFVTDTNATFLAAIIGISLFFYKFANGMFTVLHNNRKLYLLTALSAVAVMMISVHYSIVTETVFIILIAAHFYPNKIRRSGGNGGLRLSKPQGQEKPENPKIVKSEHRKQNNLRIAA